MKKSEENIKIKNKFLLLIKFIFILVFDYFGIGSV